MWEAAKDFTFGCTDTTLKISEFIGIVKFANLNAHSIPINCDGTGKAIDPDEYTYTIRVWKTRRIHNINPNCR